MLQALTATATAAAPPAIAPFSDVALIAAWERKAAAPSPSSVFRSTFEGTQIKPLPPAPPAAAAAAARPYSFAAQFHPAQASGKRAAGGRDAKVSAVSQPFDGRRFNFNKASAEERLLWVREGGVPQGQGGSQQGDDEAGAAAAAAEEEVLVETLPPDADPASHPSASHPSASHPSASHPSASHPLAGGSGGGGLGGGGGGPHFSGWSPVLVNVSPLTPGHFLLLPSADGATLPQLLTPSALRLALGVARASRRHDLRLLFNSLGAWASVNHLHLHGVYLRGVVGDGRGGAGWALPAERAARRVLLRRGRVQLAEVVGYPAAAFVFTLLPPPPPPAAAAAETAESGTRLLAAAAGAAVSAMVLRGVPHNLVVVGRDGNAAAGAAGGDSTAAARPSHSSSVIPSGDSTAAARPAPAAAAPAALAALPPSVLVFPRRTDGAGGGVEVSGLSDVAGLEGALGVACFEVAGQPVVRTTQAAFDALTAEHFERHLAEDVALAPPERAAARADCARAVARAAAAAATAATAVEKTGAAGEGGASAEELAVAEAAAAAAAAEAADAAPAHQRAGRAEL
jgi:hypothetical protein